MKKKFKIKINFGAWQSFSGNLKDIPDLSYKDSIQIRLECPHINVINDFLSSECFCSDCGNLIKNN